MGKRCDVLVTGAERPQGLAAIRALGSKGLTVLAAGLEAASIGFRSRFAKGRLVYPPPSTQKLEFAQAILKAAQEYQVTVVFPTVEASVIALDEYRESFNGIVRLALPPRDALHVALDKRRTLGLAQQLRIPAPRSCFPESADEALAFAETVGYPVVLKRRSLPSFKDAPGEFYFKVKYARNRADLTEVLKSVEQGGVYPILQEYCPGVKANVCVLRAGGQVLGIYQYRGEREEPLTGGITCLHLSESVDPDLREWSLGLLEKINWEGLAAVEFRCDWQTGKKMLMEINGRPWARLGSAYKLGLNFPYAFYRYLASGILEPLGTSGHVGVRSRYLRGDLNSLKKYLRGDVNEYLGRLPTRKRAIMDFLVDFLPSTQSEDFDWKDPYPCIVEILRLLSENIVPAFKFLSGKFTPGKTHAG